jgi:hypothetical protein
MMHFRAKESADSSNAQCKAREVMAKDTYSQHVVSFAVHAILASCNGRTIGKICLERA